MDMLLADFHQAYLQGDGYLLSKTISPVASPSQPNRLQVFHKSANSVSQSKQMFRSALVYKSTTKLLTDEANAWVDIYVAYYEAITEILKAEEAEKRGLQAAYTKVYESWKNVTNQLIRGYSNAGFEAWTIPCLYVAGKYMRVFGIKADQESGNNAGFSSNNFEDDLNADSGKNDKLEDAARVLNRIFQLCLADRAPIEESRKWGIYYIINLLFKTYFKLNSVSLSKNIMRALAATSTDMPELSAFPKSHQVTFKYYIGVINFLEENYVQAEKDLTEAWEMCHKGSTRNKELILTYLIPCHLLTTHTLPTTRLLNPYPRLQSLFLPLSRCIKHGDLSGFDSALRAGEDEFVKRRIYLTLERGRDIALRNLLRKVFVAGGFEPTKEDGKPPARRTRVTVSEFEAAISLGTNEAIDGDEVECLLANMIYKGYMKGYIAKDRGVVVLSKSGAFPGTGV